MELIRRNSARTDRIESGSGKTPSSCKHCGLPLTGYASDDYCCAGCAIAHEAIRLAGLDTTYYSLRQLSSKAVGVPARSDGVPELNRQQIASDRFIESTRLISESHRQVCLAIDGLTCAACGWLAEQVVTSHVGMWGASVSLPDATVTFDFNPKTASLGNLMDAMARFGYSLHLRKDRPVGPSLQERRLLTKVGISWALAGNVMLLAFALYSGLTIETDPMFAGAARWASLVIASTSVAYGGSVFFRTAYASLKAALRNRSIRRLHIDTPISLGILVGFGHSAWSTVRGTGDVWFDSITVLIAALLTARWLQMRSQRTAAQAASRLLDLVPSTARRILPDGTEDYVASEELVRGDSLRVDPGEIIPVDGVILSGQSTVNNAVITGESIPVACHPGDTLFAGATNHSSPLLIKAVTSGNNTRVGQLLDWLETSSGEVAKVVQSADRISGIFVVVILTVAVVTGVFGAYLFPGEVVHRIVALLVISCPCALGMSTPLAIAVANGKAARRGIYIKDGATVEALAKVQTVVFDKTGTLTDGKISVVRIDGDTSVLPLVGRLEVHSGHPVASAIVRYVQESVGSSASDVADIEAVEGCGIKGVIDDIRIVVGKAHWVLDTNTDSGDFHSLSTSFAKSGLTPILAAIDGKVVLIIGCGDAIRPNARFEVEQLAEQGTKVVLLSGDHQAVVDTVAKLVGIPSDYAFGNVDPEGKKAFIEARRREGYVMMIGDGINDAAALRTADIGVAVGNDNAPCLVASDIFVPKNAGASVKPLLQFGANVLRLIRRNLGISLVYNIAAGSAAVMGLVTPLVAAIAMPLSSLFVVTTSLSIKPFDADNSDLN